MPIAHIPQYFSRKELMTKLLLTTSHIFNSSKIVKERFRISENNKVIYEQMADRLCDEIILGHTADDRIPSVRGVCRHAASEHEHCCEGLRTTSREEIIYNRRGLGYFVVLNAREQIKDFNDARHSFIRRFLPSSGRWNCWESVSKM